MSTNVESHSQVTHMLKSHPAEAWMERSRLAEAIDAITHCASVCTACADACLAEDHLHDLVPCIRLDQDCADICRATATLLTRINHANRDILKGLLQTCATACQSCASECEQHAEMHDHCRICAESCRQCAGHCHDLLKNL